MKGTRCIEQKPNTASSTYENDKHTHTQESTQIRHRGRHDVSDRYLSSRDAASSPRPGKLSNYKTTTIYLARALSLFLSHRRGIFYQFRFPSLLYSHQSNRDRVQKTPDTKPNQHTYWLLLLNIHSFLSDNVTARSHKHTLTTAGEHRHGKSISLSNTSRPETVGWLFRTCSPTSTKRSEMTILLILL